MHEMQTPNLRPSRCKFDPEAVAERLADLTNLKEPGFSWRGDMYLPSSRSVFGNSAQLAQHARVLKVLLEASPTGFPSTVDIRRLMLKLEASKQVLKAPADRIWLTADDAATKWRTMMRHVYNVKRYGRSVPPAVQALADLVCLKKMAPPQDDDKHDSTAKATDAKHDSTAKTADVEHDSTTKVPVIDDELAETTRPEDPLTSAEVA